MKRIKVRIRIEPPKPAPRPARVKAVVLKMPKQVESGPVFVGWRGQALQKGTNVIRAGGRLPGVVKEAGPQQCVVQWAAGPTQAECNNYMQRLDSVRR